MSLTIAATVSRDGFVLDVDLAVDDRTVTAVLGPNGAGKSTLLRLVAGLERVDEGTISIADRVVDGPDVFVPPEERHVGYVPQGYGLFAHRTVLDNVAFGQRAAGVDRTAARAVARQWLDRLQIGELARRRPDQLSGGQAQRVALARALAVDPAVVLLDEPLAALDVATRRTTRRDLREALTSYAGARLLVTHDPLDVYALADRVVVIDDGRVVQSGAIAEVTARPRSSFVAALVGTNLITGHVHGTAAGSALTTADGAVVEVVTEVRGRASALIRPTSVVLARRRPQSSVRNTFEVVVDDLVQLDGRMRVGLAGPVSLTSEITVAARDALDLRPRDVVFAAVKATDIDVEPA